MKTLEKFCMVVLFIFFLVGIIYPTIEGRNYILYRIKYHQAEKQLLDEGWIAVKPYCEKRWNIEPFIMLKKARFYVVKREMTESQKLAFCGEK